MTTWEGGSLNADEAERLSASFKPIWELDDAPFAAPSAGDSMLDSLAGGGGLAPEVALALAKPTAGAGAFPLSSQKTLLGIATPADEKPAPKATASRTREAAKAPASSGASTTGAARPERAHRVEASRPLGADRADSPARKPRTLLYVVGGAAALVAGYFAFASPSKSASQGDTAPTAASRPAEPLPTAATAEPAARPAATTLAATTATTSAAPPAKAAPTPSATPTSAPARAAVTAAPRAQQAPAAATAPPRPAAPKAGSQPAGGAIVRSAPF